MLEAFAAVSIGWWLLAATTHRFRRDTDVRSGTETVALRIAASAMLVAACFQTGTPRGGEWAVGVLAAASLSGAMLVLLLSVGSRTVFAPLRVAMPRLRDGARALLRRLALGRFRGERVQELDQGALLPR